MTHELFDGNVKFTVTNYGTSNQVVDIPLFELNEEGFLVNIIEYPDAMQQILDRLIYTGKFVCLGVTVIIARHTGVKVGTLGAYDIHFKSAKSSFVIPGGAHIVNTIRMAVKKIEDGGI